MIYRELAAVRPDEFQPNLATMLDTLSFRQSRAGETKLALRSNEEAVAICRNLARLHKTAFTPDLAKSLNNLARRHHDVRDHNAALRSSTEAVAIYRELFATHPVVYPKASCDCTHQLFRSTVGAR